MSIILLLLAGCTVETVATPAGEHMAVLKEYLKTGPCGQDSNAPCEVIVQPTYRFLSMRPPALLRFYSKGYPHRGVPDPKPEDARGITYIVYPPSVKSSGNEPWLGWWELGGDGKSHLIDLEMFRLFGELSNPDGHNCVAARDMDFEDLARSTGAELEHARCKIFLKGDDLVIENVHLNVVLYVDPS